MRGKILAGVRAAILKRLCTPDLFRHPRNVEERTDEWSCRQGALARELRTATDLAALLAAKGQFGKARAVLQPAVGRFSEGLDVTDLKSAHCLLATFG